MSAIESCRTAALGGHVARCENTACGYTTIAYNSCRNRHCPKCQGAQAREWMQAREAELLPVPYFHIVFTLPAAIADIAYQNKAVIYDLLFKASSETMLAPRASGQSQSIPRLPGSAQKEALVPLRQAPVRGSQGRPRLSVPLQPSRRHLEQPPDLPRSCRRHLQMEGLPRQRPRPRQDHDARRRRVHPALPRPCLANRLPPHPPLRPVRQPQACRERRTGARIAQFTRSASRDHQSRCRQCR
jgi:hypothetical protein